MNTEAKQLEEEWVINTPSSSFRPRPALSNAANLMIKAALPSNRPRNLSHEAAPFVPQQVWTDPIETHCKASSPEGLVNCLITTYNNEKPNGTKAQKAAAHEAQRSSMRSGLLECSDPVSLILHSVHYLAALPKDHRSKNAISDKCARTVVRLLCESLDDFIHSVPKAIGYKLLGIPLPPPIDEEKALIDFDSQGAISSKEPDLIVFQDVAVTEPEAEAEPQNGQVDEHDDEPEIITIADLQQSPSCHAWRQQFIKEEHQTHLLSMMNDERGPLIIHMCMKTFKLSNLIAAGKKHQDIAITLIHRLLETYYQAEALQCVDTCRLIDHFTFEELAIPILNGKEKQCVIKLASLSETMRDTMLSYINTQLMYTVNGSLGVISEEQKLKSMSLIENDSPAPLPDLFERRIQKELASWAVKIMEINSIECKNYAYIYLTHRYVSLRWLISQRACQQAEENDYSIEASSNYNGLIYVLCHQNESLMRLAIKELIDVRDPYAAPYFAEKFNQLEFYDQYLALPMSKRVIGTVPGEQNSRSRVYLPRGKKKTLIEGLPMYSLPANVQLVIIDNSEGLTAMRTLLRQSRLCGLDTEWIPHLAKNDCMRTSLMQVGSELGVVFLLDMVKLGGFNNARAGFDGYYGPQPEPDIHSQTFQFLNDLFNDQRIIKLAYDFRGDIDMLAKTFPAIKDVQMQSFVDFADLNAVRNDQEDSETTTTRGGLAGVVEKFLNRSLNKKQQLSNWEQRPLTNEQTQYAAGDAYSLVEIFYVLCNINHPILWNETVASGPGYL